MVTEGGVVFHATTSDHRFRAYDGADGSELWSVVLPAGAHSTPMGYRHDGADYVVITAGEGLTQGRGRGDFVVAFPVDAQDAMTQVEEEVLAAVRAYDVALRDGDVDAQVSFFAADWTKAGGTSKAALRSALEAQIAQGEYEEKRFVLDTAKVAVDGDRATVDGARLRSATGGGSFVFTMRKEADGVWRCLSVRLSRGTDDQAENARELRERILNDPARPGYHFANPEGAAMPFDPNGAIYWQGRYHLFYIFQDSALRPTRRPLGPCFEHGPIPLAAPSHGPARRHVQRQLLHQRRRRADHLLPPERRRERHGRGPRRRSQHVEEAGYEPHHTGNTRGGDAHHGKYRSWDPFGWLEGDTYYAIFGGKRPGIAQSAALDGEWRYVGDLFAHGVKGVSLDEDVSCADLFELGDKHVLLCISHRLGCRYYVGAWKDEQFHPESHAQMSWADHSFFAPESLVDDKGRRIMWAWIMDEPRFGVRATNGWSGVLSLPRVLSMGHDGRLRMDVPDEIETLRCAPVTRGPIELPADTEVVVDGVSGTSLELRVEIDGDDASSYGVKVCASPDGQEETSIFYDAAEEHLKVDTRKSGPSGAGSVVEAAPFALAAGESLELRIFVDRSVVEVFANKRQAIARRIYPSRGDSVGVRAFAVGGAARIRQLDAWRISPSNAF